jgi:hypothetical protein
LNDSFKSDKYFNNEEEYTYRPHIRELTSGHSLNGPSYDHLSNSFSSFRLWQLNNLSSIII